MDLVPDPPAGMRKRDRIAYYQADLVEAIGVEHIDNTYQPAPRIDRGPRHGGLQKAVSASRKVVKGVEKPPEARGGQTAAAELAL